jgi:hypothetical protein
MTKGLTSFSGTWAAVVTHSGEGRSRACSRTSRNSRKMMIYLILMIFRP